MAGAPVRVRLAAQGRFGIVHGMIAALPLSFYSTSATNRFLSFLVRAKVPASLFWIPIRIVSFSFGKLAK